MQHLNEAQKVAAKDLKEAIENATAVSLWDEVAVVIHPDVINSFCDDLLSFIDEMES